MQNKYRNKKVTIDGLKFDSQKESRRYQELKLLERAGVIDGLITLVRYEIIPKSDKYGKVVYVADFVYLKDGRLIVEDVKGMKTGAAYAMFKLKQKLMYNTLGLEVVEI